MADNEDIKTHEVCCPMCGGDSFEEIAAGIDFEYHTSTQEYHFGKCLKCGVLYLNPRPDISELNRIYPPEYAPYHFDKQNLTLRVRNRMEGGRIKKIAALVPNEADALDAGCGGPGFLENMRRYGPPGWRLWGNDFNEQVTAELEKRGFKVAPGRFEEINLPAGSFDLIFMKQTIEHLETPKEAIAAASRLLRKNGFLIIETPNFDSWDARRYRSKFWGGYHFPRHWTIFNPATLIEAARTAGLSHFSTGFMLSPSFWIQSWRHSLEHRGWPKAIVRRINHLNPPLMLCAVIIDWAQMIATSKTSNMQIIFQKP
ncbi:MAG: class I SAM-dependent methyltransferase [bacterium]